MVDKWTNKEDKLLQSLVDSINPNWKNINNIFKSKGIFKTEQQIESRWISFLDTSLRKKKWSIEQNVKLFKLHLKIGNKWKVISEYFPGKSDNAVKNQFFSLIRKSLRISRKLIGKSNNTDIINNIKPKALCEFIKKNISIYFPKSLKLTKNKEKININIYFQKFAFESFKEIKKTIKKKEKFIINHCIDLLIKINNNYIEEKNKIKIEKKRKNENINDEISEKLNKTRNQNKKKNEKLNEINYGKQNADKYLDKIKRNRKIKKLKKPGKNKKLKNRSIVQILNLNSQKSLENENFTEDFKLLLEKKNEFDKVVQNLLSENFEDKSHKSKLINVFKKLTECNNSIENLISNSSNVDYKQFFNKKKILATNNLYFLKNKEISISDMKEEFQSRESGNFSRLNSFNKIFSKLEDINQSKNSMKLSKNLTESYKKQRSNLNNIPSFQKFMPKFNFFKSKYYRIKTDEVNIKKTNNDFFNRNTEIGESIFGKCVKKNDNIIDERNIKKKNIEFFNNSVEMSQSNFTEENIIGNIPSITKNFTSFGIENDSVNQ